jgi:hypothetical protein
MGAKEAFIPEAWLLKEKYQAMNLTDGSSSACAGHRLHCTIRHLSQ